MYNTTDLDPQIASKHPVFVHLYLFRQTPCICSNTLYLFHYLKTCLVLVLVSAFTGCPKKVIFWKNGHNTFRLILNAKGVLENSEYFLQDTSPKEVTNFRPHFFSLFFFNFENHRAHICLRSRPVSPNVVCLSVSQIVATLKMGVT